MIHAKEARFIVEENTKKTLINRIESKKHLIEKMVESAIEKLKCETAYGPIERDEFQNIIDWIRLLGYSYDATICISDEPFYIIKITW